MNLSPDQNPKIHPSLSAFICVHLRLILILPKTDSIDFLGLGIAVISAILVIRYHINSIYLILGGSIIGYLKYNYLIM